MPKIPVDRRENVFHHHQQLIFSVGGAYIYPRKCITTGNVAITNFVLLPEQDNQLAID